MQVYRSLNEIPFDANSVVTLGTFDGVHRGHCALLDRLNERAADLDARAVVATFNPHPQLVLNRNGVPPLRILSTLEERLELLERHGVTNVLVIEFTKEFAQLEAETFLTRYLLDGIGCRHMIVGHDHNFGKNRRGDLELLTRLSSERGFDVERVEARMEDAESISSTRIRGLLADGRVDEAAKLLGYNYGVRGTVIEGDGRGRTIGLPTANIKPDDDRKLLPGNGVYCVAAQIPATNKKGLEKAAQTAENTTTVFGMANIGTRPTFTDDKAAVLEVHLFDWQKMIYNEIVGISFLKFIRKERKFASLDSFLSQIDADRRECSEYVEQLRAAI